MAALEWTQAQWNKGLDAVFVAVTHLCNSTWCSGSCSSSTCWLNKASKWPGEGVSVTFPEISLAWLCPLYKCSRHHVPVYSGTWAVAGNANPGIGGHLVHAPVFPRLATPGAWIPMPAGETAQQHSLEAAGWGDCRTYVEQGTSYTSRLCKSSTVNADTYLSLLYPTNCNFL